jgi:hypothetical protein
LAFRPGAPHAGRAGYPARIFSKSCKLDMKARDFVFKRSDSAAKLVYLFGMIDKTH